MPYFLQFNKGRIYIFDLNTNQYMLKRNGWPKSFRTMRRAYKYGDKTMRRNQNRSKAA